MGKQGRGWGGGCDDVKDLDFHQCASPSTLRNCSVFASRRDVEVSQCYPGDSRLLGATGGVVLHCNCLGEWAGRV